MLTLLCRLVSCRSVKSLIYPRLLIYNSSKKMSTGNVVEAKCIFCNIIKENDPSKILYEDDKVSVFSDINPAAKCHYLIVTKDHIRDGKSLAKSQRPLVEYMVEIAEKLLQDSSDTPTDCNLGFHWPPFISVSHLHLHAISPASQMSFFNRKKYQPDSWWFVTPGYLLKSLENKA